MGDIDGDGIDDYAVGAPGRDLPGLPRAGAVRMYSGATGATIYEVLGTEADALFGFPIEPAGDVDLDGVPDFLVGATNSPTTMPRAGTVHLVSGRTGTILRSYGGTVVDGGFGASLAGLGDVDGDGVADHAIGEPRADGMGGLALRGVVHTYSGATGAHLYSVVPPPTGPGLPNRYSYGSSIVGVGDWTGDGLGDFAMWCQLTPGLLGEIQVRSGADGSLAFSRAGTPQQRLRSGLSSGEDLDGDGFQDLLFSGWQGIAVITLPSSVIAISGRDQSTLLEIPGPVDSLWGVGATFVGDSDGDGVTEILLRPSQPSLPEPVLAEVYSGRTGAWITDVPASGLNLSLGFSPAGDINGDGRADWLINDPDSITETGQCCMLGVRVMGLAGFDGEICDAPINSTGAPANLTFTGSTSVAANDFGVRVTSLPTGASGVLLSSTTIGFISSPLFSGRLCIGGGPIGRSGPFAANSNGTVNAPVDLTAVPLPSVTGYFQAILPGDSVAWQYWSRDPGSTSTLSNAVEVRFE